MKLRELEVWEMEEVNGGQICGTSAHPIHSSRIARTAQFLICVWELLDRDRKPGGGGNGEGMRPQAELW
ncbi:MAG: hypothetical protein N2318_02140 [Meiothermus sp.]|nr:hypothetical protein [Meiothermus sp.]